MTPHCRICGVEPEDIEEFVTKAVEHNEDPNNDVFVTPRTICHSGYHYDPSTNSFICPKCFRTRQDEGQEDNLYGISQFDAHDRI